MIDTDQTDTPAPEERSEPAGPSNVTAKIKRDRRDGAYRCYVTNPRDRRGRGGKRRGRK